MTDWLLRDHTGCFIYYDARADTLVREGADLSSPDVVPVHYNGSALAVVKDGKFHTLDPYRVRQERNVGGADDITIARDGFYGSAEPLSRSLVFTRTDVQGWEIFRSIAHHYEDDLRDLVTNDWVSAHDRVLHNGGGIVPLDNGFTIAGRYYDALENREALRALARDDREIVLRRGLFSERYVRYAPLVYFVAFGSEEQRESAAIGMRSLIEIGGYRGDFCVVTDRDDFASVLPADYAGRLHIMRASAHSRVEMWKARYEIDALPHIERHQPILYLDTDVVCDGPISPVLCDVLFSARICVGTEDHPGVVIIPSLYRTAEAVGQLLFEQDNFFPATEYGFNSGIVGFPDIRTARPSFRMVCRCIERMIRLGTAAGWVDQAVLNYVLHKNACVDTDTLSPRIAVGTGGDVYPYRDTHVPPALIHFWSTHAHERLPRLRSYVEERIRTKIRESA